MSSSNKAADPWTAYQELSLLNLKRQLYAGDSSLDKDLCYPPVFPHTNNKHDSLFDGDDWICLGDQDSNSILAADSFSHAVHSVYHEDDTRSKNISRESFLFLHLAGWNKIWQIQQMDEHDQQFRNIMRGQGKGVLDIRIELQNLLRKTANETEDENLFFLLSVRNLELFRAGNANFESLTRLLQLYIESLSRKKQKAGIMHGIMYLKACVDMFEVTGGQIYLSQGFVCLFLMTFLKKHFTDSCIPANHTTKYTISLDSMVPHKDAALCLASGTPHFPRPAVTGTIWNALNQPEIFSPIVFLVGMGGTGKTTAALEYADIYKKHYSNFFFLQCGDHIPETTSLEQLARSNGVDLGTHNNWDEHTLLIIDNLNQLNCNTLIMDLMSDTGDAHILITTRNHDALDNEGAFDISSLPEDRETLCLQVFKANYESLSATEASSIRILPEEIPLIQQISKELDFNLMLITIVASSLKTYRLQQPNTSHTIRDFHERIMAFDPSSHPFKVRREITFEKDGVSKTDAPEQMLYQLFQHDLVRIHTTEENELLTSQLLTILSDYPAEDISSAILFAALGDTKDVHRVRSVADNLASCRWIDFTALGNVRIHSVIAHTLSMKLPEDLVSIIKGPRKTKFIDHAIENCMSMSLEKYPIRIRGPFVRRLLRLHTEPTYTSIVASCLFFREFRTFYGQNIDLGLYDTLQEYLPGNGIMYSVRFSHGLQVSFDEFGRDSHLLIDLKDRGIQNRYFEIPEDVCTDRSDCPSNPLFSTALRAISKEALPSIQFPEEVLGAPLTEISPFCFYGCCIQDHSSVILPSGIRSIGESAFRNCTGSWSIDFSKTHSFDHLGPYCFHRSGLTDLSLPDNLETIPAHSFDECPRLQTLVLPGSLRSIGLCAFTGDRSLTGVLSLPSSLQYIDAYAFYHCGFSQIISNGASPHLGIHCFDERVSELTFPTVTSMSILSNGISATAHPANGRISKKIVEYVSSLEGSFPLEYCKNGRVLATQSMSLVQHILREIWGYDLYDRSFVKRAMDIPDSISFFDFLNQSDYRLPRAGDFIWFQSCTGESWNVMMHDYDQEGIVLSGGIEVEGNGVILLNCTKVRYDDPGMRQYFHHCRWLLYFIPTEPMVEQPHKC